MTIAAAFRIVLFAFVSAIALPDRALGNACVSACVQSANGAHAEAPASRHPVESLRASIGITNAAFARVVRLQTPGGAPVFAACDEPSRPALACTTRRVLQRSGPGAQQLQPQGSLLPYYPTAPPQSV